MTMARAWLKPNIGPTNSKRSDIILGWDESAGDISDDDIIDYKASQPLECRYIVRNEKKIMK